MLLRRHTALPLWLALGTLAQAQQPITFQYIYDDLNQLSKVIDSTGIVLQYVYDPVGNILQVNRSALVPGELTIFSIGPVLAPTGTTITIQGQGFSTTPSANIVTLNGLALTVISATSTTLVVQIPANATTGAISITVGSVTATASSPETILPAPIILTLTPHAVLAGTSFTATVTGQNLTDATFSFSGPLKVLFAAIDPTGTSATLTVSSGGSAKGYYTLRGTNPAGSSSSVPKTGFLPTTTEFNTISIPGSNPSADPDADGLTNAQEIALGTDPLNNDTDGDGYPDGLEVPLGSNPLDPASIPVISQGGGYVATSVFSIENSVSPGTSGPLTYAVTGLPFSILNGVSPASTSPQTYAVSGLTFSILNSTSPAASGPLTYAVTGLPFSILNGISPASTSPQIYAVSGLIFSLLNSTSPAPSGPLTYALAGTPFSIFNGPMPDALRPARRAPSLTFRIPIDPVFVAEALARGVQNRSGNPVCTDSDGDGLCDSDELIIGTNPFVADTDGDGYPDGLELTLGSDPLDAKSTPDVRPPGYFVTPPFSVYKTSSIGRLAPGRQGAINAKYNH